MAVTPGRGRGMMGAGYTPRYSNNKSKVFSEKILLNTNTVIQLKE